MKAKSTKLRLLITLHALYKHSDAEHRINTVRLNEYLKPYGLEYAKGPLGENIKSLREFGLDIRFKHGWHDQGFWIEDRPLSSVKLNKLIYAVTSNPRINKKEAAEILEDLKPIVTTYQEEELFSVFDTNSTDTIKEKFYEFFSIVREAIRKNLRVMFSVVKAEYDHTTESVQLVERKPILFSPKHLYQDNKNMYMVGYDYAHKKVQAVCFKDISSVRLVQKYSTPVVELIKEKLHNIDPRDYIPKENCPVLYKGPADFRCNSRLVNALYKCFGLPACSSKYDNQKRIIYSVQETEITIELLSWLSKSGICIEGPVELRDSIHDVFTCLERLLAK